MEKEKYLDENTLKKIDKIVKKAERKNNDNMVVDEKDQLLKEIQSETVRLNKLVQTKTYTQKDKDDYIEHVIPKMERVLKMDISIKDKLLVKTTLSILSRAFGLPVKRTKR